MATCSACGTIYSDSRGSCPQCGERLVGNAPAYGNDAWQTGNESACYSKKYSSSYRPPLYGGGYDSPDPAYVYATPKDRLVLGTGGFFVSLLLMGIPVIGFIIQLVWACGGARNLNRRNLARAVLILSFIGIALAVLLYFIFGEILLALMDTSGVLF